MMKKTDRKEDRYSAFLGQILLKKKDLYCYRTTSTCKGHADFAPEDRSCFRGQTSAVNDNL